MESLHILLNTSTKKALKGDAYYLAIGGGVAEHNWNHIRTVLQDQGFRCQLTDHSEDMGMISIQGPK
ncbi:sarcosine dehydrogenase, mitochondrial, partial [Lates japonicus]